MRPTRPAGLMTALALAGGLCTAHAVITTPWVDIGPSISAEIEYDSNVYANGLSSEASWVTRVGPSLSFNRAKGAIVLTGSASLLWERFLAADGLGGINPSLDLTLSHNSEQLRSRVSATYSEGSNEDPLRATRLRQRSYGGAFSFNRRLVGKWGAALTGEWSRTSDLGDSTGSQDDWRLGPRVTYAFNRYLDFYSGYTQRSVDNAGSARGTGTEVSGFDAGVDGRLPIKLLPRVNVTATAGWQTRSGGGSSTRGGLVGDASIDYDLTPMTTVILSLGQEFVSSVEGDTGRSTRGSLLLRHTFGERIKASAGILASRTSFDGGPSEGESQNAYGATASLDWVLARNGSLFARANHTLSQSDTTRREFDRTVITLGVRLAY